MSEPFNKQAASLVEETVGLIKQVLIKHSTAVLEEMYEQIVSRNDRIKQLETESEQFRKLWQTCLQQLADEKDRAEAQFKKDQDARLSLAERAIRAEDEADALYGDKDAYCEILRMLGMEEEGDPIEEVARLMKIENILRDEVNDLNIRIGRMLNSKVQNPDSFDVDKDSGVFHSEANK